MILINDASNDNSHSEIIRFLTFVNSSSKYRKYSYRYFCTKIPTYETRCDDFGVRKAQGEFVIEIQADMKILERGFDSYLLQLARNNPKLGVISCRGIHDLSYLTQTSISMGTEFVHGIYGYFEVRVKIIRAKVTVLVKKLKRMIFNRSDTSQSLVKTEKSALESLSIELQKRVFPNIRTYPNEAGWLGTLIDSLPREKDQDVERLFRRFRNVVWIGETCMRGPLVFKREIYLEVGGFDCKSFYQGLDDHDFCAKLRARGYLIAFIPIVFSSPTRHGLGRRIPNFSSVVFSSIHRWLRRENLQLSYLFSKPNAL